MYSFASLVAALFQLQQLDQDCHDTVTHSTDARSPAKRAACHQPATPTKPLVAIGAALHELDMAAIMGGSMFRPEVDGLISAVQSLHQQYLDTELPSLKRQRHCSGRHSNEHVQPHTSQRQPCLQAGPKGQTTEYSAGRGQVTTFMQADGLPTNAAAVPQGHHSTSAIAGSLLPPGSLLPQSTRVPSEHLPSLERYESHTVLRGCTAAHASCSWQT